MTARPGPGVRLSTVVMAHPDRAEYAEALARRLKGSVIVYDPDPLGERNPWRCAREAWKIGASKKGSTHVLVIQEDAIVRDDFLKHVRRALRVHPDRITTLFLGWLPAETARAALVACNRCAAWVLGSYAGWCPTIALVMPREAADELWRFDDGTRPVADDDVVGRFLRETNRRWWATVPSLANHDDDAPSLMSTTGRDRSAMCYVGDADPWLVDWSRD